MIFSFDYQPYGKRFLPIIPVKVKHKDKNLLINAYVDSGASVSTLNAEIADFLGIDYAKEKVVYPLGTAGHIKAHLVETTLEINSIAIKCNVLFSSELAGKFNLIGLQGVFDRFKITFDNKNKKIVFEEYF